MFYIRGIENAFVANLSGTPAAVTGTVTGTGVDASGTDDVIALLQDVGTVSGTSPTLDGKLQESSDNSTNWTDCSPCGSNPDQVTASNSTTLTTYQRTKSYVRYLGTIAGTNPSFGLDAVLIAEKKKI